MTPATPRLNLFGASCAALVLAVVLGGCSKFDRDWKAAANLPAGTADALEGRWKGSWKSDASGHSGGLRCVVRKLDDATYHAHFHATYALLAQFSYEMDLTAEQLEGGTHFRGQADLGKLAGGVYHYDGQADGAKFFSHYRSSKDHGHFKMDRPDRR